MQGDVPLIWRSFSDTFQAVKNGTGKAMLSNHRHRSENQIFLRVFQFQIKSPHDHPQKEQDAVCNQEKI